jgi:glycosyltransferase involved in cell wall biosynthesis
MKKKIIFLVNTDKFFISHRLPIAKKLLEEGYEVYIATEFTNFKHKLYKMGFKTYNINFNRNSLNIFKALLAIFQIFILLKKIKPNIVHLISLKPIILGGLISFFSPVKSLVISVTGLGSMFIKDGVFFKIRENLFNYFYKIIFKFPKLVVILQNDNDLKYLVKKTNLKKTKVKIIKGSGVELKDYTFSSIPKNLPIILMASRIIADKGVIEFINAAKYLKKNNFKGKFYLIGDTHLANPSSIKKSEIISWQRKKIVTYKKYPKKISKYIKDSTIFILPSYREGFPKIIMEAAACGRPVIATNVPGCRDAVINNVTGLLVPVKNYLALAKAIKNLSDDRQKLKKFGKAARKHAIINFDIRDVVYKHLCIYNSLIN